MHVQIWLLQKPLLVSTCFSLQSDQKKRRKKTGGGRKAEKRKRKIFLNVNEAFSVSDYGRELKDYNMDRIVYVPIRENYNQDTVTVTQV